MKRRMMKRTVVTLGLFAVFAFSAVAPTLAMSMGARRDVIAPHSTRYYTNVFYGGTTVNIGVSGDGSTDLDLYVYDAFGRLIDKDDDGSDECRINLVVFRTSSF